METNIYIQMAENICISTLAGTITEEIKAIERRLYFLCLDTGVKPQDIGF